MIIKAETTINIDIKNINMSTNALEQYLKSEISRVFNTLDIENVSYTLKSLNGINQYYKTHGIDYTNSKNYIQMGIEGIFEKALYTDDRIYRKSLPDGIYAYDVIKRDQLFIGITNHADDYFGGTIISNKKLNIDDEEYLHIDDDNIIFNMEDDEIDASEIIKYFNK